MIQDLPSSTAPPPPATETGGELRDEVAGLVERFAALWLETSEEPPGEAELGPVVPRRAKRRSRRWADRLARLVCRQVRSLPEGEAARRAVEDRLKARISDFGEGCLGWPAIYREAPLADELFGSTVAFLRRARAWDAAHGLAFGAGEIFQALRNVWIANGIQVLLGRPVAVTPAVFAYSMLYPLTDNFLDDPEVPAAAKAAFNRRLYRRLAGRPLPAGDLREGAVFALIGEIEEELPRAAFPRVFEALLAIHRGQCRSLAQQDGAGEEAEAEAGLLARSVEKGGASVLADGFLVAGELSADEIEFLFGYGVLLQLLDDLQDAAADRAAGHRTLFSQAAGRRRLDESADGWRPAQSADSRRLDRLTSRLARFIPRALARAERFEAPGWEVALDLIRRHCPLLLIQAVADQRELFGREMVARIEAHAPVAFAALPGLRRRMTRRWRRTERSLQGRHDLIPDTRTPRPRQTSAAAHVGNGTSV